MARGLRLLPILGAAASCAGPGLVTVPDARVREAACSGRAACQVLDTRDAGQDAAGDSLLVVTTSGLRRAGEEGCPPFDTWLVVARGQTVTRRQLLVHACNDGYGAAGGDEQIAVGPNWFEHVQSGGSAWRWERRVRLQLSPLATLEEASHGLWTVGDNEEDAIWSWPTFRGRTRWFAPECVLEGAARDVRPGAPVGGEPYEYVAVPEVELPVTFAAGGWRDAALGACAAHVDGTPGRGYLLAGPAAPGGEGLAAVLSSRGELFVELVLAEPAPGPGARLLVLVADAAPSYRDNCLPAERPRSAAWAIDLGDGRVSLHAGQPAPLRVERELVPGRLRLKILPPDRPAALSLLYEDGARTLATSRVVAGRPATLGVPRPVRPDHAVCEVTGGALEPRLTETFSPARAAIGL